MVLCTHTLECGCGKKHVVKVVYVTALALKSWEAAISDFRRQGNLHSFINTSMNDIDNKIISQLQIDDAWVSRWL